MSNMRKAQRLGTVRLLELHPDNTNWPNITTDRVLIQSTNRPVCTRCGRPSSIIYVDDNGLPVDLCRRCHPEAIGNSPGARARQAFANLFKETP